jgi:hypothetical protein
MQRQDEAAQRANDSLAAKLSAPRKPVAKKAASKVAAKKARR